MRGRTGLALCVLSGYIGLVARREGGRELLPQSVKLCKGPSGTRDEGQLPRLLVASSQQIEGSARVKCPAWLFCCCIVVAAARQTTAPG